MIKVKRIVLDVLKPHHPNVLEFARTIAGQGSGYWVNITVEAVGHVPPRKRGGLPVF